MAPTKMHRIIFLKAGRNGFDTKNIFRTISSRRSWPVAPAARWTLREPRTRRGSQRDSRGRRGRRSRNRVRKHIHFPQKHLKNKLFEIRRLPRGLQPGRGGQQPLPRKLVERNLVTDSNSNIIFFFIFRHVPILRVLDPNKKTELFFSY